MARELDILGGLSAGGWLRRRKEKHLAAVGTPCSNCETPLQGPYCYHCGQLAEGFERSIWHLVVEAFESIFHFDGRLFHTAPRLVFRPGTLTHSYLEGKRAYQIPPLRMFLIVILILFFAAGINMGASGKQAVNFNTVATPAEQKAAAEAKAKATAAVKAAMPKIAAAQTSGAQTPGTSPNADNNVNINFGSDEIDAKPKNKQAAAVESWVRTHLKLISQNRGEFSMLLEERAHWVAIGMLPIGALILGLLFVFQRRYYIFDHLIFTMHSLSFQGLLLSTIFLIQALNVTFLTEVASWLGFAMPVHLFAHMRGTYKSSIFGTLLRMIILASFSVVGFVALFMALLWSSVTALEH